MMQIIVISLSHISIHSGLLPWNPCLKVSPPPPPTPPPPCRAPILGVVPLSQLQLCLKMELASEATPPRGQSPAGSAPGDPDDDDSAPDSSPLADKLPPGPSERAEDEAELSRLASVHLGDDGPGDDLPLGGAEEEEEEEEEEDVSCLQHAELREAEDHQHHQHHHHHHDDHRQHRPDSSSEPNGSGGKIPNRDSGIDSPSCAAEGEVFPNEDAIDEEDRYDSVTETETSVSCCIALGNKRDSTQDEDSDLDEGSCGDAEGSEKTDALSEAYRVRSARRTPDTPLVSLSRYRAETFLLSGNSFLDFYSADHPHITLAAGVRGEFRNRLHFFKHIVLSCSYLAFQVVEKVHTQ